MKRHRRSSTGGISDTWNYNLRTVDDSFAFTREFTDALSQEMMDEERLLRKHRLEKEHHHPETEYPNSSLDDRPEKE